MTKDKLSQKEIDALVSKLQTESRIDNTEPEEKTIIPYNFKSQKKLHKNQLLLLESLHMRFLRNIESSLTNLINIPVVAAIAATTELSYDEFSESISPPTCIYLLSISPGTGKAILEIDPNFAFFVIDKVLGGSSSSGTSMNRELSLIEEKIMYRVVNLLLRELEEAWKIVDSLKFEIEGYYAQLDYINVIGESDKIILISVDLRGGDNEIGFLNLCLPINVVLPFLLKEKESELQMSLARSQENLSNDRKAITYQITKSIIPLRIILGNTKIKVGDLLKMEAGDVISLDSKITKPLDIFVGNLKMYQGWPVKKESFVNIKISDQIKENKLL